MKKIFSILTIFIFLQTVQPLQAQEAHNELGIGVGAMHYRGELAPIINLTQPSFGVSAFFRRNSANPAWSFRGNFLFGRVVADDSRSNDAFALARNHSFKTTIIELAAVVEYNFFDMGRDVKKSEYLWTPYLFAGLSGFRMDPGQNIRPTYGLFTFSIPFGVGAKFYAGSKMNIGVEFGARWTFTDFLDDVGMEVNLAAPGSRNARYYTGNPNDTDMFFYTSVNVAFVMFKKASACPIKIPN
ncbi:MAG: hypothetical protein EAZ55_09435 [Cytophagales bacterium]|nr:MAG: hypothetical protein EAZ55_09435 [Cytophagales bacterium]